MTNMGHMAHLVAVAHEDVQAVRRKESTYRGSWKKRGGVGAWHMLARKMDRLEHIVGEQAEGDIFAAIENDPQGADGSALAEIRDLRRYLLLVESEMCSRAQCPGGKLNDLGVHGDAPEPEASSSGTPLADLLPGLHRAAAALVADKANSDAGTLRLSILSVARQIEGLIIPRSCRMY